MQNYTKNLTNKKLRCKKFFNWLIKFDIREPPGCLRYIQHTHAGHLHHFNGLAQFRSGPFFCLRKGLKNCGFSKIQGWMNSKTNSWLPNRIPNLSVGGQIQRKRQSLIFNPNCKGLLNVALVQGGTMCLHLLDHPKTL